MVRMRRAVLVASALCGVAMGSEAALAEVMRSENPPQVEMAQSADAQESLRLYEEGLQFFYQGTAEGYRQAISRFEQALELAERAEITEGIAYNSLLLGRSHNRLSQRQAALSYYQTALEASQKLGNRELEAATLTNIGVVYNAQGNRREALNFFNQALPILREVGDRAGEAATLNNIGFVYNAQGNRHEALNFFNQALPITQEVGDRAGEANTLTSIGLVHNNLGNRSKALDYYNQALPITQEFGDRATEATILNNAGSVYNALGNHSKALDYYNQALPILREVGDRAGEAATLSNIGSVYNAQGNRSEALNYLNQALPIRREVDDRAGEATTLHNIGAVYNALGNRSKALNFYNQALPIWREVDDRVGKAATLNRVGEAYDALNNPSKALNFYNQALPIRQEVGDRAGEAATLSNIGFVYRDTDRPKKAIEHWEKSLNILLSMRGKLKKEHRDTFLQTNRGAAVALVDLLIDRNQPQRAFEWANRVTTYELADYNRLLGATVENPEAQAAIDEWNQQFQELSALRQQLQDDFSPDLARQIREQDAAVFQLGETIANDYPEAAELFEFRLEDLAQLQARIPPGTVVLQPILLTNIEDVPDTVALFLLTRDDPLTVKKVPIDPEQFDNWVREYRRTLQGETTGYRNLGGNLYDVLIRPVEADIAALDPQQLAIIATGKLRQFPFETLWDNETQTFLLEKYPVHYLTRLSSRSLLAQPANRFSFSVPAASVALLLGAVGVGVAFKYGWKAGGVVLGAAAVTGGVATLTAPSYAVLGFGNPRAELPYDLPAAETEVLALGEIAPDSEILVRETATLEQFKAESPRYRYLHLATHGCFQELGCCLGDDCEEDLLERETHMNANTLLFADGEYPLADAALLGLNQTELVALSACQTALQTNRDGDAIAGMAYLWERAGARAVMATLWNVEDNATQGVVTEFYRLVVEEQLTKAEALRQAKLQQMKTHPHPFYWSPLVLIGDPR